MLEIIKNGKELVFRGNRREVNARLRLLKDSDRRSNFTVQETDSTDKFKKKRNNWEHN